LECSEDDVGEASFEEAEGFEAAVAVGAASVEEGAGVGVPVGLDECYAVEGGVELAVAGAVEPVPGALR